MDLKYLFCPLLARPSTKHGLVLVIVEVFVLIKVVLRHFSWWWWRFSLASLLHEVCWKSDFGVQTPICKNQQQQHQQRQQKLHSKQRPARCARLASTWTLANWDKRNSSYHFFSNNFQIQKRNDFMIFKITNLNFSPPEAIAFFIQTR